MTKILITGATGLIGSALAPYLEAKGHSIVRLVRRQTKPDVDEILWNPESDTVSDCAKLEGLSAVIHLAGENVGEGRWTPEKKRRIRDSRVKGTTLLVRALLNLRSSPPVLISASAIGIYGDRGDEILYERSAPGTDFLARVCQEWEAATLPAVEKCLRVVNARFGIVLTPAGGALAKLLTPFRLGAGGKIGTGAQYMSWITLDDAIEAIYKTLMTDELSGAVNIVAPNPLTNAEFTKTLGKVLSRPTLFAVPAFAARLAFGEMADALLLAGQRVEPARLKGSGFIFRHAQLEDALQYMLNK